MNGKVKILFFCMIFVAGPAFSQKNHINDEGNLLLSVIKNITGQLKNTSSLWQTSTYKNKSIFIPASNSVSGLPVIAANYYTVNFGFFCKKELLLEKTIKIPVKFRLGSLQQCDYLEGKRYVNPTLR